MELEAFIAKQQQSVKAGTRGALLVIALDMDGVLCQNNWHELDPVPIKENIERFNRLFDKHFVVIHTARPDRLYEATKRWLVKHKVRFNLLATGKLAADVYIDDKSWNPNTDQGACQCHVCLDVDEPYP